MSTRILAAAALVLLVISPAPAQPGFATYLIAFLTQGTAQPPAGASMQELQKAHLAHLDAMWKEGLLLASGPIATKGELRGVLIFGGEPREQIERRVADDPLLKTGVLQVALGPWIGPTGIGDEYRKWAAANPGAPDKMRTYQLVLLKAALGQRMSPDDQRALLLQMDALAKSGKLAAAGPVLEGSDLAWVYLFSADAEETDSLAAANPAVKAGKMLTERHAWMVAEGVLPAGFKVPM
jgi:uncharacterized protein YciI